MTFLIKIKRVYDSPAAEDGFRILVDRLWPRGMSKEKAELGLWMKEIAPSNELRQKFSHEAEKWPDFQKAYRKELEEKKSLLSQIKQLEKEKRTVTLVYSARETQHNNAQALKEVLEE